MGNVAIELRSVRYQYPDGTEALKGIDLTIERGECVTIMGQNGAGKTTLCLLLNGIIPHIKGGILEGDVIVDGLNTKRHPVYELAQRVGIVLQDPDSQLFCPDVKSEVCFGLENLGVSRDEMLRRLEWTLEIVRLKGMEELNPNNLSGGQKQRLALAAVLAMKPKILVLDEPTSQLDPIGTAEVFSVIKTLKEEYCATIVIASHKSEEIAEFADRVVVLHRGRIVTEGTPEEIFSKIDLLKKIYVKVPDVTVAYVETCHKIKTPIENVPIRLREAYEVFDHLRRLRRIRFKPQPEAEKIANRKGVPIIEVRNLWYVYPGPPPVTALKNVNLKIFEGEFVGIIGQNGSGKTTLVKNIIGLLKPTRGVCLFKGENISKYTVSELARHIGLVLQNPETQLFALTVREEVAFGPRNLGLPPEEVERRVDEALKLVGLEGVKEVYPPLLSFGDKKKLSVATVLALDPEVIILDEPTTGQDYKGRYQIMEIVKRLNERGKTVIVISHDMDLIAKYTERTIVMGLGHVLIDDTTRNVFSHPEVLEKTYLKPPQITMLSHMLSKHGFPGVALTLDEFLSAVEGVS
ncbi:MAG: ABC transporter [Thermoprotei archaeon]|nr:MAG: ABC transporter [Thermoprotei archaeon]